MALEMKTVDVYADSSSKRIDDRQTFDTPAGLKVLRQQCVASGFKRRCDDQRVVEAEAVRVGKRDGLGVDTDIDWANRIERCSHVGNGFGDNLPFEAELAAEDGSELVQNLHADYAARQDHLSRHLTFCAVALGVTVAQALIDTEQARNLVKAARAILDEAEMVGLGYKVNVKGQQDVRASDGAGNYQHHLTIDVTGREAPPSHDPVPAAHNPTYPFPPS